MMKVMMRDLEEKYHWIELTDKKITEYSQQVHIWRDEEGYPWQIVSNIMGMSIATCKKLANLTGA